MTASARDVALTEPAHTDPVVGVVVHRVDVDRGLELRFGRGEAAGAEVRARECLPHRALRGLERARPLERDDRRVRVVTCEQPGALLERDVRVLRLVVLLVHRLLLRARTGTASASSRHRSLWYNRTTFPSPERSVARIPALCRHPLRLRRDRRGTRGPRRSTLRRRRRGGARGARGRAPAELRTVDPASRRTRRRRPVCPRRRAVRDVATQTASWWPTRRPASTRTGWSTATITAGPATPAASSARSACPKPAPTTSSRTNGRCRRRSRTGSRSCRRCG